MTTKKFPFLELVSSMSANAVILKLDQLFAIFETPHMIKADNGKHFNGEEFAKFIHVPRFKHRKVTLLWPRANEEVEKFVKILKGYIEAAKVEGEKLEKGTASHFAQLLHLNSCNHCGCTSCIVETSCVKEDTSSYYDL